MVVGMGGGEAGAAGERTVQRTVEQRLQVNRDRARLRGGLRIATATNMAAISPGGFTKAGGC